jgi:hypothetical protein
VIYTEWAISLANAQAVTSSCASSPCPQVSDWSLVVKTFVGPKGSDKRRTKSKAAWVVWSSCRSQVVSAWSIS